MITVYFGSPGSGKTTMAVRRILKARKHYAVTYANFCCSCADFDNVNLDGLGEWTFEPYSLVAIDEAGIVYNNRKYKSLPQETIEWFKLHRHYHCDVDVWSQSWEDMDITIRRLADRLYYIKRIGPFTLIRRVYKRVTINKETEQIIDGYKFVHMLYLLFKPFYYASYLLLGLGFLIHAIFPGFDEIKLVLRAPYYKYFDTYSAPELPIPYDLSFANRKNTSFSRGNIVVKQSHITTILPPGSVSSNRIQGMLRSCAAHVRRTISKVVKTTMKK